MLMGRARSPEKPDLKVELLRSAIEIPFLYDLRASAALEILSRSRILRKNESATCMHSLYFVIVLDLMI